MQVDTLESKFACCPMRCPASHIQQSSDVTILIIRMTNYSLFMFVEIELTKIDFSVNQQCI